jgi:hypothetical protein
MMRRSTMKTTARAGMATPPRLLLLFSTLFGIILHASGLLATSVDEELMSKAKAIFGPLPPSMPSEDNPITAEKVKLGNALFWETGSPRTAP